MYLLHPDMNVFWLIFVHCRQHRLARWIHGIHCQWWTLNSFWLDLQPILSLQVCQVGTQRNNNPSHKTDILCFHKIDWLERCHPHLAPILAIPCLPRSFQNILDALSVMLKCWQLRRLALLCFKAVPRVEIMFRLAQVLVRGAGLIKWYYIQT